jgi:hypothetical protein
MSTQWRPSAPNAKPDPPQCTMTDESGFAVRGRKAAVVCADMKDLLAIAPETELLFYDSVVARAPRGGRADHLAAANNPF